MLSLFKLVHVMINLCDWFYLYILHSFFSFSF